MLSIFPLIDTEACSSSVRELNERAACMEVYIESPAVRAGAFLLGGEY
ncbi:hypothetical protein HMPREF3227_02714 [Corynebacterium sp. CMW7794]|nr:hypothetical protein HMPREF3227_02714 [Corynebacterium sp. CMW7794]